MTEKELDKLFTELTDSERAYLAELIDRHFIEKDVKEYLEEWWDGEFEEKDVLEIADDVYDNYNYTEYFEDCIYSHFEDKEE